MLPGIDISHFQGTIDWAKVKAAGIQFAYLKATQGASFTDPKLAENYAGATGVGIPVGLYHVFVAHTGQTQRSNWQSAYAKYTSQLAPWLDLEPGSITPETAQQALDMALAFRMTIYGSPSTLDLFDQCELDPTAAPLAVAHYGVETPRIPKPWTDWMFWQHSCLGTVDGISTSVDLDWFNGDDLSEILRVT